MTPRNADAVSASPGSLLVVTGTGTSVGKTHVVQALMIAWRKRTTRAVVGLKPVESGVGGGDETDEAKLHAVSTFHVKQSPYQLSASLSPHLAARDQGIAVQLHDIVAFVNQCRKDTDTVVELPGGLFTPLSDETTNADLIAALAPDWVILVAPDRLGVLHDVIAAVRAASTKSVRIDGIVLVSPAQSDESTGRNAAEIPRFTGIPVWAAIPRGSPTDLSDLPAIRRLVDRVVRDT